MECTKCKKKMLIKGEDFSYDFRVKPKKKYKRSIYWCELDDIWVNVEIPLETKSK